MHITGLARVRQPHGAASHRIFNTAHNQIGTKLLGAVVAEVRDFFEIVTGVNHQQRVGNVACAEGFFGTFEQHQ